MRERRIERANGTYASGHLPGNARTGRPTQRPNRGRSALPDLLGQMALAAWRLLNTAGGPFSGGPVESTAGLPNRIIGRPQLKSDDVKCLLEDVVSHADRQLRRFIVPHLPAGRAPESSDSRS